MTQVPATLTSPRGSMGEQVDDLCSSGSDHIGQDFRTRCAFPKVAPSGDYCWDCAAYVLDPCMPNCMLESGE